MTQTTYRPFLWRRMTQSDMVRYDYLRSVFVDGVTLPFFRSSLMMLLMIAVIQPVLATGSSLQYSQSSDSTSEHSVVVYSVSSLFLLFADKQCAVGWCTVQ